MVTPSKHRYLRTNRIIPTCSRELFRSLDASNLPLSKTFQIEDIDLVVEHFEEQHLFNDKFYNELLRDESCKVFSLFPLTR